IEYAGGTPDYTFQLAKENMNTSVFEIVSNPNIDDNTFTKRVEFRNLGVGTYRITITDQNGCFLTTESIGDISVSSTPLPVLGLEEIAQITCPGAPDGTITVTVSGGITPYNYQWTIYGVISSIQNNGNQVISLNNISEPGEYILKVASRGFTDFTNPSGYATSTINLIAPDEVIIQNAS